MTRVLLLLCLLLTGCGANPLSLLTGGGPNVAANVQAGRTNVQTLGSTEIIEAEVVEQNEVKAESIGQLVVNQSPKPIWIVAFLAWTLLLLYTPTPHQMGQWIRGKLRGTT
jgi:hypothetical protein